MQTNLMQNFSALLNQPTIYFGGQCVCRFSPKPVAESASADFIGRRRLRASFIKLFKLTRHRRGADTARSCLRSCVSLLSVFEVTMASVLQYFSGQQNTEPTDSIYNNSKSIVTFMKV